MFIVYLKVELILAAAPTTAMQKTNLIRVWPVINGFCRNQCFVRIKVFDFWSEKAKRFGKNITRMHWVSCITYVRSSKSFGRSRTCVCDANKKYCTCFCSADLNVIRTNDQPNPSTYHRTKTASLALRRPSARTVSSVHSMH